MKQVALNDDVNDMLDHLVEIRSKKTFIPETKKRVIAELISKAYKKEAKDET